MVQFLPFKAGVEVNGQTIATVLDLGGFSEIVARYMLEENFELPIRIENWYPQVSWLNVFKRISERIGESTLFEIGKRIPMNAKFPDYYTAYEALSSIDIAYHMNHRNAQGEILFDNNRDPKLIEGIGHYGFEKLQEKLVKMVCENPYPHSFDWGIITSMAQKFESQAEVKHDEKGPCRKNQEESCTYLISW